MVFVLQTRYRNGVSGRIVDAHLPRDEGMSAPADTGSWKISAGFNNYTICLCDCSIPLRGSRECACSADTGKFTG